MVNDVETAMESAIAALHPQPNSPDTTQFELTPSLSLAQAVGHCSVLQGGTVDAIASTYSRTS